MPDAEQPNQETLNKITTWLKSDEGRDELQKVMNEVNEYAAKLRRARIIPVSDMCKKIGV
jgi:hypothetical protein